MLWIAAVAGLAGVLTLYPLTTHSDWDKALYSPMDALNTLTENSKPWQIKEAIIQSSENKEQAEIIIRLADCESGFRDICIVDTNGKLSCGIFQFQEDTLKYFCPDLEWGKGKIKDSIICAIRVIREDYKVMKKNWVICSKKIFKKHP